MILTFTKLSLVDPNLFNCILVHFETFFYTRRKINSKFRWHYLSVLSIQGTHSVLHLK